MELPVGGSFGSSDAALAAFEDGPQLCLVVEGDQHRLVAANASARDRIRALGANGGDGPAFGLPVTDVVADLVGGGTRARLDQVRSSGVPHLSSQWRVRTTAEGRAHEALVHRGLVPWLGEDGEVRGVVAVGVDITDTLPAPHEARADDATGHGLMVSIQDAMLPDDLPVLPGVEVAARYLLAGQDAAAGGDWFDTVVRDDGRVVLVVGDVVGHGVAASAVMGQLRAVLHERLASGADLGEAITDLDRFARSRPESRAATVVVVELDPATGEICYCTAGHPPPLVVDHDGTATFLSPSGGAPLGTTHPAAVAAEARLGPGELVLLYSDGVVDRPGRSHTRGVAEVREVFSHAYLGLGSPAVPGRTVERVCQQGLEVLARITGHADDMTVVAAQRVPAQPPLALRLPAVQASIGTVREALRGWLAALGTRPLDEISVQHAVGELVTNVVEHAYAGGTAGEIRVDVANDRRGDLVASVGDDGRWRSPRPAEQGVTHGLALARGLVDSLDVDTGAGGTTVTVRSRLSRTAQLLQGRAAQQHAASASALIFDDTGPDRTRVRVAGSLDASNADVLRASSRRATAGGTRPRVLDLTGVTHLGSAAVQALHEVLAEGPVPPQLYAPAGSVAQHVMELVRLPHSTVVPT